MTELEGSESFVRLFVGDSEGPDDYVCFFEDTGETGDLYISDRNEKKIVGHLQIYVEPGPLNISEEDVVVMWSKDQRKCGVLIKGKMKGIFDLASQKGILPLPGKESIVDREWLSGFEQYL
jgi:hypothetical protein